ncbi:MAG TPA: lipid-A-disaccharide synthase, partial [Terriglobales bacterium]|nr:lipid-A-disaccharide synthase [Terriglobales bacterium]
MRILISAGEASGEMYGAQLIRAMQRHATSHPGRARAGDPGQQSSSSEAALLEFFGVGGEKMRAAGCDTIVDAKDLAVVGISEILGHLPKIWRLFHQLVAEAGKRRPGLAIVIDSPAFNWRVARQMKKRGIPVVYYVCPQFWAWRQGRVRLLRKYVDKALVIFPFEEKFYRDHGVDATFVGHPLAGLPKPAITREAYAAEHRLDPAKNWITLMPGSRVKEVRMNLPTILQSAAKLGGEYEFLLPVAPTLDRCFLTSLVGSQPIHLVSESLPALAHSRAGIVASGTATVEGAMMGTPFVMVYRVSAFTYFVGRRTVKVPHFAMVNLIAGKEIVPELVQHDFTAEKVVAQLQQIIADGPARDQMILGLQEVRDRLGHSDRDQRPPADQASDAVFKLM